MNIQGGCLCGAIRYALTAAPLATAVCHCRNCQKQSGAAFSVNLVAQAEQIDVSGPLSDFEDRSDAGHVVIRRFCATCGSPILSVLGSSPGIVAIKAGTLDDTSIVNPGVQLWCASGQNWLGELPGLPAFERDIPPRTPDRT